MLRIDHSLFPRIAACAAAVLLASACQNVPKYKRSSGKFDEWNDYQGKHFFPSNGTVTAIDPAANMVTITSGKDVRTFAVTAKTRIMNEGTDITLAQFPLNHDVKYTVSEDGTHLLTLWYGTRTFEFRRPGSGAKQRAATL